MRWDENFSSILREKDYNIIWTAENGTLENSTDVNVKVEYMKDGKNKSELLADFLKAEVDESLHEFI